MSMCIGVEELFELAGIDEVAIVGKNDTIGAIHVKRLGLCMSRGSSSRVPHCSAMSRVRPSNFTARENNDTMSNAH